MSRSLTQDVVDSLDEFIHDWLRDELAEIVQSDEDTLEIEYSTLQRARPDIADDYRTDPDWFHDHFRAALDQHDFPVPHDFGSLNVRVVGLESTGSVPVYDVGEPSVTDLTADGFATLRGQVSKRAQKTIRYDTIFFECQRCGSITDIPQPDDGYQEPHECQGCERQGPFTINADKSRPYAYDHQLIRLQTMPEHAEAHGSANLDVHLENDLVDEVSPGDRVAVNTKIEAQHKSEDSPDFEIYGTADSIDPLESDFSDIDVDEHMDRIEEIAAGDPVDTIANSIAPKHIGDEEIKRALALQLAGAPDLEYENSNSVRGTVHIFLVGDPGVGKSKLLQQVRDIAPRSVFTNGAGSTRAGLTGAAMQDDFGDGGWTIEAGALVEAHEGICCIDELDDMTEEDRAGLLEAMSEQEINLSKAGMSPTLPANTSVLAAANPKMGRFDRYEGLAEQIDVHPALISRFDLVFTLTDEPDEEFDSDVADAVNLSMDHALAQERDEEPPEADEVTPDASAETLRAYFAHARTITPRPTDEAMSRIKHEYQAIRQSNEEDGPVPTTPRTLQTLHRLSAAHARLRLSEQYTQHDVQEALKILMSYLNDVGIDPETDALDADVVETGTSKSQRDRVQTIRSLIQSIDEEYDTGAPHDVVIERAEELGIDSDKAEQEIEKLSEKGEIYSPRDGHYHVS